MYIYKLIKSYPGCDLPIGSEVKPHYSCPNLYQNGANSFDKYHIEEYPEFWQKVEEIAWFGVSLITWNTVENISTHNKDHAFCG